FICTDDQPDRPAPPSADKERKPRRPAETAAPADIAAQAAKGGKKKPSAVSEENDLFVPVVSAPPTEMNIRRTELEDQFRAMPGPMDEPERLALWPELAQLNTALKDMAEAGICWTNAFWGMPEIPPEGAWAWLRGEDPSASRVPTAAEFDAALGNRMPSPNEV